MTTTDTKKIFVADQLKPSAQLLADELIGRGATVNIHDAESGVFSYQFDSGPRGYFQGSTPLRNSMIGGMVSRQKPIAARLAKQYGLNVPIEIVTDSYDEAVVFVDQHAPVVLKPTTGAHGKGVVIGIKSVDELNEIWRSYDGPVMLQEQCSGDDLRILMLDGEVLYTLSRLPARVTGDGRLTIAQLIAEENAERQAGRLDPDLKPISERHAREYIGNERYGNEVPAAGQVVRVCGPVNQSIGGSLEEYPGRHRVSNLLPSLKAMSNELGLSLVAFDFMVDNDTESCVFIECNATPAIWQKRPEAVRRIVDSVIERQIA